MSTIDIARRYFDPEHIEQLTIDGDRVTIGEVTFRAKDGKLRVELFPDEAFLNEQDRVNYPDQFAWTVAAFAKVRILQTGTDIQRKARTGELYNEDYFTKRGGGGPYIGYPYQFDGQNAATHLEHLADEVMRVFKPKNALDLGCATGIFVRALKYRGCLAEGIDISKWAIDNCVTTGLRHGSLLDLPFSSDAFDLAISQDVMEHIHPDDLDQAFSEQVRVVKPGGVICHFVPFYPEHDEPVQIDCHLTNASHSWWLKKFQSIPGTTLEHVPPATGDQWIAGIIPLEHYFFLRVAESKSTS